MPIKFGSTNKKVLIQNLKNRLTLMGDNLNEKVSIPKEIANQSPYFHDQEKFKHLVVDGLNQIADILTEIEDSLPVHEDEMRD